MNRHTASDREVYRDAALLMISTIRCTPAELRTWWVEEIGRNYDAKPRWGKRRVPPGRARMKYNLTPMDCFEIEQACEKRLKVLEASVTSHGVPHA